ncbi:MAG TPA: Ig-like domain-containing protein, partial [Streptomyces sp.]|nr:Ig-like domain-containing protein [Streptomyces sp.]
MRIGRTGTTALASALSLSVIFAAGCSSGGAGSGGGPAGVGQTQGPVAKLAFTPANGTKQVAPNTGIEVKVSDGKVAGLTVADAKGREVKGAVGAGGAWRPQWALRPSTTYTVSATATGTDGRQVTGKSTFTTLKPKRALQSGMAPLDGEKVGVGMPVQLLLSQSVTTKQAKAAVERALVVRMSKPVEGAWSWVSDREVQFRPHEYWPVGEKVSVVAHLAGVQAGQGLWGTKDRSLGFTVGARHITKVNARTHKAVVTDGDEVVKTIPVSLGKPGDDSYSGTMIAQEKAADIIMDSATIGHPGE